MALAAFICQSKPGLEVVIHEEKKAQKTQPKKKIIVGFKPC